MTLLGTFILHELTVRRRDGSLPVTAGAFLLACLMPAVVVLLCAPQGNGRIGSGTFAAESMILQPVVALALSFLTSAEAFARERDAGSFAVMTLAPISNSGFVLRRWLAQLAILIPLSLAGVAASMVLTMFATRWPAGAMLFVVPWAIDVLPVIVIGSAAGVGIGTIFGGGVSATLSAGALGIVIMAANWLSGLAGYALPSPRSLVWGEDAGVAIAQVTQAVRGFGIRAMMQPATDAPYDATALLEQRTVALAFYGALAFALLAAAIVFFGRTRRDIPPRAHARVPFAAALHRLRVAAQTEPFPEPADRAAVTAAVALLAIALGFWLVRDQHYRRLAAQRFSAETAAAPLPMPASLVPLSCRIVAGMGNRLHSSVSLTLQNNGAAVASALTFQLNPTMRVAQVRVENRGVRVTRRWDRVALLVQPGIAAGESAAIRFEIEGDAGEIRFGSWSQPVFTAGYRREAAPAFSEAYVAHASSSQRVLLDADSLVPVPRYTAWRNGAEAVRPLTEVSLRIHSARDATLVSACGGLASDGATLDSRCTLPLADMFVAGGLLTEQRGRSTRVLTLPEHAPLAVFLADSLDRTTDLVARVWPGTRLPRTAIELPPAFHANRWREMSYGWVFPWTRKEPPASSEVLIVDERDVVVRSQRMAADQLSALMVEGSLLRGRDVDAGSRRFLSLFFRTVTAIRTGGGAENGAIAPKSYGGGTSFLAGNPTAAEWRTVFPAILVDLQERVGAARFAFILQKFLASHDKASVDSLFAALTAGDPELAAFRDDFLRDGKLPLLTMSRIRFEKEGRGWRVAGEVRNDGGGTASVPVVLSTVDGRESERVHVSAGASVPFTFFTAVEPVEVLLDPDQVSFRGMRVGQTLRFRYGQKSS